MVCGSLISRLIIDTRFLPSVTNRNFISSSHNHHLQPSTMTSPPPTASFPLPISPPPDDLQTFPHPTRRPPKTIQSQSKPVYPSYHLEPPTPSPVPRATDFYRPLNILRVSPRTPQIRLPCTPVEEREAEGLKAGLEEFIAVVFGNEVWMGLVDFKSDRDTLQPSTDEENEDDFGTKHPPPHTSNFKPSSPLRVGRSLT